ncbi:hypothetical protein [Streptomyces atroolivaceus]|uniref:Uncharacterized protein n=1 Tax=Streptomyces atroolivaceus TaxID=66869 RepID=A0ABV9VMP6_STRAZ|nr:hypothetical protein [Streptomyces atroolivaceus]
MTSTHQTRQLFPTSRASTPIQWAVSLDLATLSGPERRSVSSRELAGRSGLGQDTVAEIMAFLGTVGLVEGTRQECAATVAGWEIATACRKDETQGRLLLLPLFLKHWSVPLVYGMLLDAPVEQTVLVSRLRGATGIAARRAQYLVEWLMLALVLRQDPAMRISPSAACTIALPSAPPTVEVAAEESSGLLMGLTFAELRSLPPEHYVALLKQVPALYDLDPV